MAELTTLKRSKQREAIVAFLKTRKDHPTADTVYQEIRHSIPNISLGTVYRNLSYYQSVVRFCACPVMEKLIDLMLTSVPIIIFYVHNVAVFRTSIFRIRRILTSLPKHPSPDQSPHMNCYFMESAVTVLPAKHNYISTNTPLV